MEMNNLISPHINSEGVKIFAVWSIVMASECDAIRLTLPLSFVSKSDIEEHNLEMQDSDHDLTSCYLQISMDTDNKKPMPVLQPQGTM